MPTLSRLVRAALKVPGAAVSTATSAMTAAVGAAALGVDLVLATAPTVAATVSPRRVLGEIGDIAAELTGTAGHRRYYSDAGHHWIEVRGLDDSAEGRRLGRRLVRDLSGRPAVEVVELNHPLSRVVVQVAHGGDATRDEMRDIVSNAELELGVAKSAPTDLPGDGWRLASSVTAASLNAAGLGIALVARTLRAPALPAGVTAAVTFVDYQPRLRRLVEARLGGDAADVVIALAGAAAYTLSQAPASLAVDTVMHCVNVAEAAAAQSSWRTRHDLGRRAAAPATTRQPRPVPRPPGPVERYCDGSALVQSTGAAALGAITRDFGIATTAAVVSAPKAARNCREAFASTLARGLARDHGVLPLHPESLRRLDRVDAIIVDPRALCSNELRVNDIRGVAERDRARVWEWAQDALDRGELPSGWQPVTGLPELNGHRDTAEVLIGPTHQPLAAALLEEARGCGTETASLDAEYLGDLRPLFDDLHPGGADDDEALTAVVNALQSAGRTVAVVSRGAPRALSAADVAIGVMPLDDGPVPWQAHLLADDLAAVWHVLHALPAARRASRRGVEIAVGASVLGGLLMIPGVRGRGPGPVTAGAGTAIWVGVRAALTSLGDDPPAAAPSLEWHAMPVGRVRRLLPPRAERTPTGENPDPSRTQSLRRAAVDFSAALRDELSDPLTPVLAIGSAASAVLGSPVDALLVGSVLTGNAALAATQRVRAERLLHRLLAAHEPPARLLVDGDTAGTDANWTPAAELRPGDVIEVRSGEVVAADARLVSVDDLEVDESALTGESLPVSKQVDATPAAPVAERNCMIHAGSTVVAGTAVAIVTTVGRQTQAGRAIAARPGRAADVGLQSQLRELTDRAWPVSLAGGAVVGGLGLLRRVGVRQAVSSAVAVSVAAVPEGLPLVATLAQQASARRLSRLGALVRSPRSIEALGRVDVVCFDKTGTLSLNRLKVAEVRPVAGAGRDDVLRCAGLATPAAEGDDHAHATDAAVATASKAFSGNEIDGASMLPFRSGRPFSAALIDGRIYLKGAPEVLLAACTNAADDNADAVHDLAVGGLRVLAVAYRDLTGDQAAAARADDDAFAELCGAELTAVGLLGLSDTARPESATVLDELARQGIGTRLITGDHPVTATAIAAELGLAVGADGVITGTEWQALSRRGQERAVADRVLFARMSPEHKVQIVETLQRTGHTCAMVGDGANDAAAIRAAAVGVGVASAGSDPARTAADVMLLDGNITALLDALDEGRQLWRRVQAAVSVLLGGNAGEVVFAILGTALTGRAPLNARQLLLVNLLTDALPAAALAVSPPTERMRAGGRGPDQAALWRTVAVRGGTTAAAATAAWVIARFTGRAARASTIGLVALVATQLGQTLLDSRSPLVVTTAVGSLLALASLITTPGVSQLLGSTPLGPVGWTIALSSAALATLASAVISRMVGQTGDDSGPDEPTPSTSTSPTRHRNAYNSRTGKVNARVASSVRGSDVEDNEDTPDIFDTAGVAATATT